MEEIKRVAGYSHLKKYNLKWKEIEGFIQMSSVHFSLFYPIKSYIPEDENDNYIVGLALQTNSGFITSGDKHILSQRKILEAKFKKLKIISKAEFEKKFNVRGNNV